jgi:hypothetical protein
MTAMVVRTKKRAPAPTNGVAVPEAKPAGSRDILPPLTEGEIKNGWTPPELDAYLRGLFNGDAYSYRYEILSRWREQERIAGETLAEWKREHDGADPAEKRRLNELELHAAHCRAMATRAAEHLEGEQL